MKLNLHLAYALRKHAGRKIAELFTRMVSPVTARSVVDRSDISSTTPASAQGSMVIVSLTENQPSKNMRKPAMMSVRNRWPAKPIRTTMSRRTGERLTFEKPEIWRNENVSARP